MNDLPLSLPLDAPIPSKKNNRIVLPDGRNFPSKAYQTWHRIQLNKIRKAVTDHGQFNVPVSISLGIAFGDNVVRDLDNALTSVLDLLKDSKIIVDDNWKRVSRISCDVLDTRAHYAVVTISPMSVKR